MIDLIRPPDLQTLVDCTMLVSYTVAEYIEV